MASATVGTMRTIGMMLSLGIATLIFALVIGRVQITPEYYAAFLVSAKLAFTIFTAACFGGIFASLARGKMHGPRGQGPGTRGQQPALTFGGRGSAASQEGGEMISAVSRGINCQLGWPA